MGLAGSAARAPWPWESSGPSAPRAFSRPGPASAAAGAALPRAHPRQCSSFGRRGSRRAPSPGPAPRASSPFLSLLPSVGTRPWLPRAGQLGAYGRFLRRGRRPSPSRGPGRGTACLKSPDRVGMQRPLTRWLRTPRGCASGSLAPPGCPSQIRTAKGERERASGVAGGERERGPCSGTCGSPRECTLDTRGSGTYAWIARVYLLNRLGGTLRASETVSPASLPDSPPSLCLSVSVCISLFDHPKGTLAVPFHKPFDFFKPLPASSPSLHRKTEKESSSENAPW